jgi:murein endopeptidase
MAKPKLAVVGKGGESERGNPDLIALLERLLFDARSGQLTGISAVIEMPDGMEFAECHDWGEFFASGAHNWASLQALTVNEDD